MWPKKFKYVRINELTSTKKSTILNMYYYFQHIYLGYFIFFIHNFPSYIKNHALITS